MVDEGKPTVEIAEHFGVSTRAIGLRYEALGIKRKRGAKRRYAVNERFFDEWSADMAYALGFVLTDGHIQKSALVIAQRDIEPLEAIRDMMASEHPIKRSIVAGNPIHTLIIGSRALVDALARLGIHPAKSRTVAMPNVPDAFLADFLRGVIDGDGWAHPRGYVVTITSGSANFAQGLTARLNDAGFPFEATHDGAAWRIKLSGKDAVMRLESYLYRDPAAFYIARKRERIAYHVKTA